MTEIRRIKLHDELKELLGSNHVYFQPLESVRMKYPAIVYNLDNGTSRNASNKLYVYRRRYAVTVIDKNPDTEWDKKLLSHFDYCSFERAYVADNLNHWQFSVYY